MDEQNSILKDAFLVTVENQLNNNEPPETRQTLERLVGLGISTKDAKLYLAQAVSVEVLDVIQNQQSFNRKRFIKNLQRLPDEPG